MTPSLLCWLAAAAVPSLVSAAVAVTGPSGANAGINSQTGERPFRQNILQFQNSGAAWDLYIQAHAQFAADGQSNQLSYYQISGIHGYPSVPWDGVTGGGYQPGYCTHNSILFPTWHRPYLALFEQILWNNAQVIAGKYTGTQKATYQAAAQKFRMPYWDWAANATIPDVVNTPRISINTPTGRQTVDNPLYTYKFHPQPSASDFPHDSTGVWRYPQTVRCPDSRGNSQPNVANSNMRGNAQALHDQTYQLLSSQTSYGPFSNTGWPSQTQYNSVEDLHNRVHGLVGGNGHMAWVPYSSFDPIFWLHHTNVDRIFAIWQALYPDSYVTSEVDSFGTYTNRAGSTEDVNTPLTPFHSNTGGTLYTSTSARSTRTFGYSVPEVVDWNVSKDQLAANTRRAVNQLYNPTGGTSPSKAARRRSLRERDASANPAIEARALSDVLQAVAADRQWALNFKGDKKKIPVSVLVHFFLNEPKTNDPNAFPDDPAFVATQSVLIDPALKANAAPSTVIRGQIPLTHKILDAADDLGPRVVVGLLKRTLTCRAVTLDGHVLDAKELEVGDDGVYLEVVSRDVRQKPGDDTFPEYGEWATHANGTFEGGTYDLGKSLSWLGCDQNCDQFGILRPILGS